MLIIEVYVFVGDNYFGGEDFMYLLFDEVLKCWNFDKLVLMDSDLVVLYVCVEVVKCVSGFLLCMSWFYQECVLESMFYDDELEVLWLLLFNWLCMFIEQVLCDF